MKGYIWAISEDALKQGTFIREYRPKNGNSQYARYALGDFQGWATLSPELLAAQHMKCYSLKEGTRLMR